MSYLMVKNLVVGYEGRAVAEGISFQVNPGDYLCIVGENGSGKSTLMKTLLRLQEPLGGEILYGDDLKPNEIGYLPQQTVVQKDFPASVREIVLSGLEARRGLRPFYNKAEKALAEQNMERMRVADLAGRCYRELSGGQQQRVLLARALCATGKVLVLDEPVSGLDPKVTAEMYELIHNLNQEGISILMISHDVPTAVRHCSHVLHIGKKLFFCTREAYLKSAEGLSFARENEERQGD